MHSYNKRAVTNVEMVAAIVIFVFAVFSMLLAFNVFHKPMKTSSGLEMFEQKFLEMAGNYTKFNVYVRDVQGNGNCINISLNQNIGDKNLGVFFGGLDRNNQIEVSGEDNYLLIEGKNTGIYDIYAFSFDVTNQGVVGSCDTVDYNCSIPGQGKIFSYGQLDEINQSYYGLGYSALKNEFGSDFNLKITDESGSEVFSMFRAKPQGSEVYSKNFRIKIYNNKDNQNIKIINAMVNVQVW